MTICCSISPTPNPASASVLVAFVKLRPMTLGTCTLLGVGVGAGLGEPSVHAPRTNKVKTIATTALVPLNIQHPYDSLRPFGAFGPSTSTEEAILPSHRDSRSRASEAVRSGPRGFRPSPTIFGPLPIGQHPRQGLHLSDQRASASAAFRPDDARRSGPQTPGQVMAEAVQALQARGR